MIAIIRKPFSRCICTAIFLNPLCALADIVLDGTTGTSGALSGPNFQITENLGTRIDTTLVHSFNSFDLSSSESATFQGDSAIRNVINRVTGTSASTIDGRITSTIGTADIWFMNPNGIVFGDNATLNVPGAFVATTADALLLENDSTFSIDTNISQPGITIDNPKGVVFSMADPADIEVLTGTRPVNVVPDAARSLQHGDDLVFAAGNITVTDAHIRVTEGNLSLISGGGVKDFTNLKSTDSGDITVTNSRLGVGEFFGGAFQIIAGELSLINSEFEATLKSNSTLSGGTTEIDATEMEFIVATSGLEPTVDIQATTLQVVNGSELDTSTESSVSSVRGADLVFSVGDMQLSDSVIKTVVAGGNQSSEGGAINISATNFTLTGADFDGILGTNRGDANSITGDIIISVSDTLRFQDGGTFSYTRGNGGLMSVEADQIIAVNSESAIASTFNDEDRPGQTSINANRISLDNSTLNNRVTNNGAGGSFVINTEELLMTNGSFINTTTFGLGTGVDLDINAKNITMQSGSVISASALGRGGAGSVNIDVSDSLVMEGSDDDFATSIRSTVADLEPIDDFAVLVGRAGFGEGQGGSINVNANELVLRDGAQITAFSSATDDDFLNGVIGTTGRVFDSGDAGNISIAVRDTVTMTEGAAIQTNAEESGGGNVIMRVANTLRVSDSSILAEAGGTNADENGGNITIDASAGDVSQPLTELVVFENARVNANANAGNGGDILIRAQTVFQDSATRITASSTAGVDGAINREGLSNDVSAVDTVAVDFDDVAALLTQKCAVDLKDRSTFIVNRGLRRVEFVGNYQSSSNSPGHSPLSEFTELDFEMISQVCDL